MNEKGHVRGRKNHNAGLSIGSQDIEPLGSRRKSIGNASMIHND